MSEFILPIVTGIGAAGVDGLVSVLFRPARRIGVLFPNVVLNEHHVDTLAVTQHPVQQGANISDHAYKMPPTVTIQGAWSNSSYSALLNTANLFAPSVQNILGTLTDGIVGESYSQQVYNEVLKMQEDRIPVEVVTGKRLYKDMLITSVEVNTDNKSEYILAFRITAQQVLITTTTTVALPPTSLQRNPASVAPIDPQGQVYPRAVSPGPSALRQLGGIFGGNVQ